MIATQSLRDDHEPRSKLAPAVGNVAPQASKIITQQLVEDVGVKVHRSVPIAGDRASNVQD